MLKWKEAGGLNSVSARHCGRGGGGAKQSFGNVRGREELPWGVK